MRKCSRIRSVAKALSWRGISLIIICGSAIIWKHDANLPLLLGVVDALFLTGLFYFHERLWSNCSWGLE